MKLSTIERCILAVISAGHIPEADYILLEDFAYRADAPTGDKSPLTAHWVHALPMGYILRFKYAPEWRDELREIGASEHMIALIEAVDAAGFDGVHLDVDADQVAGLPVYAD